jgi:hypothetical protein
VVTRPTEKAIMHWMTISSSFSSPASRINAPIRSSEGVPPCAATWAQTYSPRLKMSSISIRM